MVCTTNDARKDRVVWFRKHREWLGRFCHRSVTELDVTFEDAPDVADGREA